VQNILKAFDAAAVLLEDPTSSGQKGGNAAVAKVRRCKYKIESGDVFDALLVFATRDMPSILMDDLLGRPEDEVPKEGKSARGKSWKPQKSAQWTKLAKPIGQYCGNLVSLLQATTENQMMSWVLKAVGQALPLICATPKCARTLLKTALTLWATGDEGVRARSYFVIRGLSMSNPKKLLPLALKGVYLTYIRHTKTSNPTALLRINFFVACISDLYGLDMELAYENTFLSIRQLAVTLRNALTAKTGSTSQTVCCWPFVNALRCWGQVRRHSTPSTPTT
jgi:nucleolar complex protein 2